LCTGFNSIRPQLRCSRPLCSSQGTGGTGRVFDACSERGVVRRPAGPRTIRCGHPSPQGPTACLGRRLAPDSFHSARAEVLKSGLPTAYWSMFHP